MPNWDEDSPQLRTNLHRVLLAVRADASKRAKPTIDTARGWHRDMMHGLTPDSPKNVGRCRGEPGPGAYEVEIDGRLGVRSDRVRVALKSFEAELQQKVAVLDKQIGPRDEPKVEQLAAVIDLCAWVHSEWVRIHPFANGNGRTARLWANSVAMRYGLPPFVRLRPRPDGGYGAAAAEAMTGRWQSTARVFRQMYYEALRE